MSPNTSNGYNLPPGVTELSRAIYDLHMEAFWICVGIAIVVFGAMIYSLVKFRHSQGAVADTSMLHSTKVEIAWTIVPVIILVVMAIPAAELILKMEDMRNSELSIRVTGYQWKWQYQYMDAAEGINFFSTLAGFEFRAPIALRHRSGKTVPNYCSKWIIPWSSRAAPRCGCMLTSQDVIHAWYVPDFGLKRQPRTGLHQRAVVQGRCRQRGNLPRAVRRAVRARSRLHARGGRCAHAR